MGNILSCVVQVIHDEGIIHNDLKPENFVCKGRNISLIDFGISSRITAEHTSIERDVRCGTVNYMAPETIEASGEEDHYKVCVIYMLHGTNKYKVLIRPFFFVFSCLCCRYPSAKAWCWSMDAYIQVLRHGAGVWMPIFKC